MISNLLLSLFLVVVLGGEFYFAYYRRPTMGLLVGISLILTAGLSAIYLLVPTPEECATANCEWAGIGLYLLAGAIVVTALAFFVFAVLLEASMEGAYPMSRVEGGQKGSWHYVAYLALAVIVGVISVYFGSMALSGGEDVERFLSQAFCLGPVPGLFGGLVLVSVRDRARAKELAAKAKTGPTNACS